MVRYKSRGGVRAHQQPTRIFLNPDMRIELGRKR